MAVTNEVIAIFIYIITSINLKNMKSITINKKKYKVKYTIRALFIFEQITQKPFKIDTLLDNYIFFYSMILANNQDKILDWNEYLDAIDANPNLFKEMNDIVNEEQKKNDVFDKSDNGDGEGKKD